ncbi:MAG: glycosyltransferase family 4 protein, partial [Gemmatimonadetes bacterium]|nr:glycosyltransferase family 4 protein [Gemmatimonadota bacterium]
SLTMAPLVRQVESLRAAGMNVTSLEVTGWPKVKYLSVLPEARRLARKVDLIHAHYGFCGWVAKLASNRPIVVSLMGSDLLGAPDGEGQIRFWSRWEVRSTRFLAPRVDQVIVKSPEMARMLPDVQAHVIPNGVDLKAFRPRSRVEARRILGWDGEEPIVLFPGNPAHPRKAYPLAERTVQVAQASLGSEVRIVALRGVAPEQVPTYMNACDAMVLTSLIEGSPNVVKEAMASDLPVVAVSVGDVGDLLDDVAGCFVCTRDAEVLGERLAFVLRERPVARGREAVMSKGLDQESVARRIIGVYEAALSVPCEGQASTKATN